MTVFSARYIWVVVDDLVLAHRFYLDILKLKPLRLSSQLKNNYLLCDLSPVILVVAKARPDQADKVGRWTGLSINVQDLESTINHLINQGVKIIQEPEKQPWGGWQATVDDGNGNQLMLSSTR